MINPVKIVVQSPRRLESQLLVLDCHVLESNKILNQEMHHGPNDIYLPKTDSSSGLGRGTQKWNQVSHNNEGLVYCELGSMISEQLPSNSFGLWIHATHAVEGLTTYDQRVP